MAPEFAGVIAGQGLFVALEHLGDLHDVGDVDVGQHVHQLLQVLDVLVAELGVFQLAVGALTIFALKSRDTKIF
jgi:hypothetical protein